MVKRIHGMKSGRCLRDFNGHTSYISSILLSSDGNSLVSSSGDGLIKIWSYKSGECLNSFHSSAGVNNAVNSLDWISDSYFVVCCRSPLLYIMSTSGQVGLFLDLMRFLDCNEFQVRKTV